MPLKDYEVKNAKPADKPYKLTDGGGLYLYISNTGARLWRYKYRIAGKEGTYSIGAYPEVSLAKAREEHTKARELVKLSIHPTHDRQLKKLIEEHEAGSTFKAVAQEWVGKNKGRWSPYYLKQVEKSLSSDIYPTVGALPIKQVTAVHILKIMQTAESRGAVTIAILIRQWCSAIFRFAAASLRVDTDPAAALKSTVVRPKVKHNRPLTSKEIPLVIAAIEKFGGYSTTRIAIELLLLTFVRTVELRKATWDEIDLDKGVWRIPAVRMKMKTEHIIPLAAQAISLLSSLKEITGGSPWLFPNYRRPNDCMTATTINRALERMGFCGKETIGFTAHGFRGTASTLLYEQGFRSEVIEKQLAHSESNKVKASYNQAQYLAERSRMMQQWADYIDSLKTANKVVPIKSSKLA